METFLTVLMIIVLSFAAIILLLFIGVIIWALWNIASDVEETYIEYKNKR